MLVYVRPLSNAFAGGLLFPFAMPMAVPIHQQISTKQWLGLLVQFPNPDWEVGMGEVRGIMR